MNPKTATTTPPVLRERPALDPGFLRALQGCWHLTWKSRLTARQLPLLLATVLAVPLLAYLTVDAGHDAHYFNWVVSFYLQLALPFYCLTVFGDLIRDDLQANTLHFFVTRPVPRAQFFLVKFLCLMVWMQILAAVTMLLFMAVGLARGISGATSLAGLVLGAQFLAVLAFGCLSSLFGMIHKRYLVLGLIYGAVVEVGIGQIPTNINALSITRHLKTILGNSSAIADLFAWSPGNTPVSIFLLCLGSAIFLALATAFYSFREYHFSEEMQK